MEAPEVNRDRQNRQVYLEYRLALASGNTRKAELIRKANPDLFGGEDLDSPMNYGEGAEPRPNAEPVENDEDWDSPPRPLDDIVYIDHGGES